MRGFENLPPVHRRELRVARAPIADVRHALERWAQAGRRTRLSRVLRFVGGVLLGAAGLWLLGRQPQLQASLLDALGLTARGHADLKGAVVVVVFTAPGWALALPALVGLFTLPSSFATSEVPGFVSHVKAVTMASLSVFDGLLRPGPRGPPFGDNTLFFAATLDGDAEVQVSVDETAQLTTRSTFVPSGAGVRRKTRSSTSKRSVVSAVGVLPAGRFEVTEPVVEAGLEQEVKREGDRVRVVVQLVLEGEDCTRDHLLRVFDAWRRLVRRA